MKGIAFCITLLLPFLFYPQENTFNISKMPDDLREGASASVLKDYMDIEIKSRDRMNIQVERVVTVFNKSGDKAVRNFAFYDGITRIKDLSAEIYDAKGALIEKIKKKDFKDASAVDGFSLYTDSRLKYFSYTPLSYPYTVAFTYTYETGNTAFIPPWTPVDEFGVSVIQSRYSLIYPPGFELRIKEKNLEAYPVKNGTAGRHVTYEMEHVSAIVREALSPEFATMAPRVLLALDKFHLEGVDGYGTDWNSFGKWQYDNLLRDRDELPQATIDKIGYMLRGIEDPIEKTRMIYQYVQENTRYISVQLGIGGWMPITASEVDKVKYGDCKGLTNYTKALLKSQGIASNYSVVWAGNSKRGMEPDFASMQGNHVILNVPVDGKDLWLECTSQVIPFGFLGDFTDDRDVLVITADGGQIKHTPSYLDAGNKKVTKASCILKEDGFLEGEVQIISTGIEYDNRSPFTKLTPTKQEEYYKEYWDDLNGISIKAMEYENKKEVVEFRETVSVEIQDYASSIGDELLFRINMFDVNDYVPDRYRKRKHPFHIPRGFLSEAVFTIDLPAGYTVKSLPEKVSLNSNYGEYTMEMKYTTDGEILYKRRLFIQQGEYPCEDYEGYRDFRRATAKNDNLKLVISKQ